MAGVLDEHLVFAVCKMETESTIIERRSLCGHGPVGIGYEYVAERKGNFFLVPVFENDTFH